MINIKKVSRYFIIIVLLLSVTGLFASAEATLDDIYNEQLAESGAEEIWSDLPSETKDFMNKIGVDSFKAESFTGMKPDKVINSLFDLLKERATGPFRSAGVLLGVVLLYALMDGMRQTVKEESISKVFGAICAITACAALLVPISGCIRDVSNAAKSTSVFMFSYVPVFAGIMLASGQAVTSASYQTVVLFAAELISLAATHFIVPMMTVSLAMGLTGSVTPNMKLDRASSFINSCCGWLLGLITSVFVGLLSMQGMVGSAVDTMTGRAIRFSLGAFVPVVGSALGEAYNSVRGCLSLLKSTLGGFGILATALIMLPPLIECIIWLLSMSFCIMVAEMFSLDTVASLFKTAQGVLKTLIGVLSACSMFMIVATAIVTVAGKNAY
ncbi:MAG: hypothetical protein PHH84_03020 [Oscillospiraceae bacterium]|nr:hypothetical protein [Oscillospiraceae bacterium]MDD4413651.1 hypothetical protein [Oscillospiraceae bacterium]